MRIVVNRKEFIKSLPIGGAFAGKNKALPILDCVKIKVKGDTMNIVSSNIDSYISKRLHILDALEEAQFCVNYTDLLNYTKLLTCENVVLNIEQDGKYVVIIHERGSFKIPTSDVESFPSMKKDDNTISFQLSRVLFNNWIYNGCIIKSLDTLRPALMGIYLYYENGNIGCASSDGIRLFSCEEKFDFDKEFGVILNAESIKEILSIPENEENIEMHICKRSILIKGSDFSIYSQNIEGRYPNIKSVIPKQTDVDFSVNKKMFIESLNRCRVSAQRNTESVKLELSDNKLKITSTDLDYDKESSEVMVCNSDKSISISFSIKKLLSIVNLIESENIHFYMKNSSTAVIIKEDDESSSKTYLLMPIYG